MPDLRDLDTPRAKAQVLAHAFIEHVRDQFWRPPFCRFEWADLSVDDKYRALSSAARALGYIR